MKKSLVALSIAAIALSAGTAFAQGPNMNRALKPGVRAKLGARIENRFVKNSKFLLTGKVVSTTSNSVTVTENAKGSINVQGITNSTATVATNSNTKITKDKNTAIALSDLKAGDQIVITGSISGTTNTAVNIRLITPHGTAMGEVTAKTDNSITIKNNNTGVSQTFTTDGNTKVNIDGQSKTTADVQVGDKGFVKFRSEVAILTAKVIGLFR